MFTSKIIKYTKLVKSSFLYKINSMVVILRGQWENIRIMKTTDKYEWLSPSSIKQQWNFTPISTLMILSGLIKLELTSLEVLL